MGKLLPLCGPIKRGRTGLLTPEGPQEKECSLEYFLNAGLRWCFQIPAAAMVTSYYNQCAMRDTDHRDTQTKKGTKTGTAPRKDTL